MRNFFSRLSYSFGNEDWKTEQQALQIEPKNRVICITASGDRPLHLLTHPCKEMVAVDMNPLQNNLLELKCAAMRHSDPDEYLALLGVMPSTYRKDILQKVLPHMSASAAKYWRDNIRLIHDDLIYQGALETWARRLTLPLRMVRSKEIHNLFSCAELEEQRHFMREEWSHAVWKTAIRLIMNRGMTRLFFKDPGMYANLDQSFTPADYLYNRLTGSLDKMLARRNSLMCLIFLAKVLPEAMPPYLTHEGIKNIVPNLDALTVKTTNVITYLEESPESSFDRFSLSDVASYIDYTSYLRLLKAMYRAAKPGARFCLRQTMTRYKIPEGLKPYFAREPALEQKLENEESHFVYHFTVGKILKD